MAGSLILATLAVKAQRTVQSRRIGWLWNGPPPTPAGTDRYTNHLRALGWTEGQNLVIERRYANGDDTQLPGLVQQLMRLKVELIVAEGTVVALMAKRATSSIPIVVARSGDPFAPVSLRTSPGPTPTSPERPPCLRRSISSASSCCVNYYLQCGASESSLFWPIRLIALPPLRAQTASWMASS